MRLTGFAVNSSRRGGTVGRVGSVCYLTAPTGSTVANTAGEIEHYSFSVCCMAIRANRKDEDSSLGFAPELPVNAVA